VEVKEEHPGALDMTAEDQLPSICECQGWSLDINCLHEYVASPRRSALKMLSKVSEKNG